MKYLFLIIFAIISNNSICQLSKNDTIERAKKIYISKVARKPDYISSWISKENRETVFGYTQSTNLDLNFTLIKNVNGNWQIVKSNKIVNEFGTKISVIEKLPNPIIIDNKKYHFLTLKYVTLGNCCYNLLALEFIAIDLESLMQYKITYSGERDGEDSVYDGEYDDYDKNFPTNLKNLKNKLESYARNSKFITKQISINDNLDDFENYDKKYIIDNPFTQDNTDVSGVSLNITYYDKDLTKMSEGYIINKYKISKYLIYQTIGDSFIGLDTQSNKYFPLYINTYVAYHSRDMRDIDVKINDNILSFHFTMRSEDKCCFNEIDFNDLTYSYRNSP
jgi:hypothetical protein